jgi:nucleoside-diphosphate-sugar epimerase
MNRFLVTGATGFVGHFLCARLLAENFSVRGTLLESESPLSLVGGVEPVAVEPLGPDTPWHHALSDIDTIIHLAARVHIMNDTVTDPLTEFRKVNVAGTLKLARDAACAGVRRFVYISSIKVNGEESAVSYTPDSPACPCEPYGISKWEAEVGLHKIATETGLEVVVVRPTLAYGPGVKGNFIKMMKAVAGSFKFDPSGPKWVLSFELKGGIPLPFASICNSRSLIYVGNLVDALAVCATHPDAAGKTYMVSDGEDVSTPELIRRTASALGVPARLLPFPVSLMKLAANVLDFGFWILNFGLFGSKALNSKSRIQNSKFTPAVNRLTGSLTVDNSKIRQELGWVPPFTMEEGLLETAAWFKGKYCPRKTRKNTENT